MIEKRNQFYAPSNLMKSSDLSAAEEIEEKCQDCSLKHTIPINNTKKKAFRTFSLKKVGLSTVWSSRALRIIYLITRFLIKLRMSTYNYKFKLMTPKIY